MHMDAHGVPANSFACFFNNAASAHPSLHYRGLVACFIAEKMLGKYKYVDQGKASQAHGVRLSEIDRQGRGKTVEFIGVRQQLHFQRLTAALEDLPHQNAKTIRKHTKKTGDAMTPASLVSIVSYDYRATVDNQNVATFALSFFYKVQVM